MTASVTDLTPKQGRFSQVVAANIRAEMARRNVQQVEIALALRITQQAVSLKIHGHRPIQLDELAAIADVLGVSVAALVADDNGPRPGSDRDEGRGSVRHQGLEPRTRWLMPGAPSEGLDGAQVLPFRHPGAEPEVAA